MLESVLEQELLIENNQTRKGKTMVQYQLQTFVAANDGAVR